MHQRHIIHLLAGAAAISKPLPRQTLETGAKPVLPAMSHGPSRLLLSNNGNIFIVDCDGSNAKIIHKEKVDANPSWMAFVKPNLLYTVDENSANTRLFHIDFNGKKIEHVKSERASTGVVHLEINKFRPAMLGSAYGNSSVDVWNIYDGQLQLQQTIPITDQVGPVTDRQDKPHPHQTVMDPSGRYFAVNDLGTDKIVILDSHNNVYNVVNHVPVSPPGCGPRHGAFYPVGADRATHYILLCEIKNLVILYSLEYNLEKGIDFQYEQTFSTFGSPQAMPATAAAGELVLTPDNKHVYVSNRLTGGDAETIAHFKIVGGDGDASKSNMKLEFVGLTSTFGRLTRMFSLSLCGRYLYIGNQDGELGFVALKRNSDGTLVNKVAAGIPLIEFGGEKAGPAFVQEFEFGKT